MRIKLKILLFLFWSYFIVMNSLMAQAKDENTETYSEQIKSVDKVEELYTIRFNMAKVINKSDLTMNEQAELVRSLKLLAEAFKSRNHFRNAADVYSDYLELNNSYLTTYNAFSRDSLLAAQNEIVAAETSRIMSLDAQINTLNKTREAVTGLKQKYYTFGGIAAFATLILSIVVAISKTRAIADAEKVISKNRTKLLQLYWQANEIMMLKGSIGFTKATAISNIELIDRIIEDVKADATTVVTKEVTELQKATDCFESIN